MLFLHLADLHLEESHFSSKAQGLRQRIKSATEEALEKAVDLAINKAVDAVIISGDLYHTAERSIAKLKRLASEFSRLDRADIPVYLIHGNHDYVDREEWDQLWPSNVHVFGEKVETMLFTTKSGERVALSGFSYHTRWIEKDLIQDFPSKGNQVDYHIGLLHGAEATGNVDEDHYAPFQLADMLIKGYDYWALGHIHQRSCLNEQPPVIYPGNIQGRHRKEVGEKGGYLVELNSDGARLNFVSCAPLLFEKVTYEAPVRDNFQEALADFQHFIERKQAAVAKELALDVTFVFHKDFPLSVKQAIREIDLCHYFNQVYLAKVTFIEQAERQLIVDQSFSEDLEKVRKSDGWPNLYQEVLSRLLADKSFQSLHLLDLLDEDFQQEVEEMSQKILLEDQLGGK